MDLQKELTKKDKMESLEERKLIIELFDKYQNFLPQSQKQAMYLRFFEDLSYSEIGEILANTRTAVFDAIKKGKQKLLEIDKKIG